LIERRVWGSNYRSTGRGRERGGRRGEESKGKEISSEAIAP